jgi:hypothetical protein
MSSEQPGQEPDDSGLVSRLGPLEIDWPKAAGYYAGIALAVAFELIEPPLALFIAAIPIAKMLKRPGEPGLIRVMADFLEGAEKPVGGDAESVIRIAEADSAATSRRAQRPRGPRAR